MSEASAEVSLCAVNFAVLDHAENQQQIQHDMQTVFVSILASKNKLSDIQNLTFFDMILQ